MALLEWGTVAVEKEPVGPRAMPVKLDFTEQGFLVLEQPVQNALILRSQSPREQYPLPSVGVRLERVELRVLNASMGTIERDFLLISRNAKYARILKTLLAKEPPRLRNAAVRPAMVGNLAQSVA